MDTLDIKTLTLQNQSLSMAARPEGGRLAQRGPKQLPRTAGIVFKISNFLTKIRLHLEGRPDRRRPAST